MDERSRGYAGAAVAGVLAGFLSGLFGVGGGILIVPALVLFLRMDQRVAHGTSLAAIVPIAGAGVAAYALEGSIDWPAAGLIVVGASVGAVAGTRVLRAVPQPALRVAFALLLLATAARMLVQIPDALGRGPLDPWMVLGLVVLGLVSGTLAGLLGVGGGIVIVPVLVLLFSVPDAVAKGTSLAVIIPTAAVGTASNLRHRNVVLATAVLVGMLGVVSAYVGAQISVRLDPVVSARLFAALLTVTAAQMLLRHRRRPEATAPVTGVERAPEP